MFLHCHPYPPYLPVNATKLIVGTIPPPRFSTGKLFEEDVDFCYGSRDGLLWPVINHIHKLELKFEHTDEAISQRQHFLTTNRIGIYDIVAQAYREKMDASDLGMQNVKLRNLTGDLKRMPEVKLLIFTGGNSKNGPEYFFRKQLKEYGLALQVVNDEIPRIHQFVMDGRIIKTVSLTAPSGSANRAIGSMPEYKRLKKHNPEFNTFEFRVLQYSDFI